MIRIATNCSIDLELNALKAIDVNNPKAFKLAMDELIGTGNASLPISSQEATSRCENLKNNRLRTIVCKADVEIDALAIDTLKAGDEEGFQWLCNAIECINLWWREFNVESIFLDMEEEMKQMLNLDFGSLTTIKTRVMRCLNVAAQQKNERLFTAIFDMGVWLKKNMKLRETAHMSGGAYMKLVRGGAWGLLQDAIMAAESHDAEKCIDIANKLKRRSALTIVNGKKERGDRCGEGEDEYGEYLRWIANIELGD